MKKILTILTVIATACATVHTAKAQFISGPSFGPVLTNGVSPGLIGRIITNFGINASRVFPVGVNGVQLWATVGSTNALTVTNSVLVFELIGPRRTNGAATPLITWALPAGGASTNTYTTNFNSAFVAAQGNTVLQNATGMRLFYASNANTETIFLNSLDWSTR